MDKEVQELAKIINDEHQFDGYCATGLAIAKRIIKEGYRKQSPKQLICVCNDLEVDPECPLHKSTESSGLEPSHEGDCEKWLRERHPEHCKCGVKIEKKYCGINGVDVCESCFREATKHMKFGTPKEKLVELDRNKIKEEFMRLLETVKFSTNESMANTFVDYVMCFGNGNESNNDIAWQQGYAAGFKSKFGTPAIPSVEDIMRVITDNYATCDDGEETKEWYCPICAHKVAQAIHNLISQPKEK